MNRRVFHFTPTLDVEKLQIAAAAHFCVEPANVFVYLDAVDIWGSANRDPDPAQSAAFYAAAVRILIRRYEPNSGPIEGWLSLEPEDPSAFEDAALARALSAAAGVTFYYADPVPDPDDEPGIQAAQVEVRADGVTRKVWLSEFSDASGTQTIVSGRGEDEDSDE